MITVSHPLFVFITGPLIPLVTGLLTKLSLPGWVKGLITLLLDAVVAFLTTNAADGIAVFSTQTLVTAVVAFAISVTFYQAIWRNTPLTSSKPENKLLPNFGIGKAETSE
jgi:hypothetical protein